MCLILLLIFLHVFQFLGFPSASHSMDCSMRLFLVSSDLASSTHDTYSFFAEVLNSSKKERAFYFLKCFSKVDGTTSSGDLAGLVFTILTPSSFNFIASFIQLVIFLSEGRSFKEVILPRCPIATSDAAVSFSTGSFMSGAFQLQNEACGKKKHAAHHFATIENEGSPILFFLQPPDKPRVLVSSDD